METVPSEIVHPSGLKFRVNLTVGEIERIDTDPEYANHLIEKYFQLYQDGLVSAVNEPPNTSEGIMESQSASLRNWSPEDEESLIRLVSDRRPLFGFRIPLKERSRDISRTLWEEIIREMNVDVTVDWITKKWKHIRDSFIRVRGNIKRKMASGSSAEEKVAAEKLQRSHKHYELLLFLEDTLGTRKTTSNFSRDPFLDEDQSLGSPTFSVGSDTPSTSRSQPRQGQGEMNTQDHLFIEAIKSLPGPSQLTATQNFCLRLADGMEKLPPRVRNQLQLDFLTQLTKLENQYLYDE